MATKKTISNSFVVNTIEDGERGKVGRFFYFAGDFDSKNNEKKFLVNDAQAPFFKTGETTFHVFNPEVNGEYTMSEMWEESVSSFNNKPFEIMTNDFKYLITEALFSENAHLGSAIINGDWMMSTHGQIGGVNFLDDNYIEITDVESKNTDLTPPYTLFSTDNPSSDGSIEHDASYGTGDKELKVEFGSVNTNKFLENIKLEENTTYFAHIRVRTEPTGGNGNYYLKVDETDVGSILTSSNVYETKIIFFKVQTSGNYTLSVRTQKGGTNANDPKYGSLGIDYWKIGVASFAPRYAVNLKTGMSLQGYGFSSGAIRRNKVVINDFSKGYYTYGKVGYDVGILDLDKCGSYVELDGIYVYLQLPMYCHSINASEEERNKARSFVGTKLLIYIINDGGIYDYFKNNEGEKVKQTNAFLYKVAKVGGKTTESSQQFTTIDGTGTIEKILEYPQFVELECVTGTDEDGEIIYWKVNTIGKI